MTTYKSARAFLAAVTFLAITVNGAPPAFADNRLHLPTANHQVRPDIQIHANGGGLVPHFPMQSLENTNDPFADIHLE
jgi:hypothetical protein